MCNVVNHEYTANDLIEDELEAMQVYMEFYNCNESEAVKAIISERVNNIIEDHLDERAEYILRNNEYYNLQETFDELYAKSKRNYIFTKLMHLITSRDNIQLAYRNSKAQWQNKTTRNTYNNG